MKFDYVIYWIHYPLQNDPYTEGYIGITNNLKRRIYQHKNNSYNYKLKFLNFKDLIITVLYCCTKEEAFRVEEIYRPEENIGWNITKGGILGHVLKNTKLTEVHKRKIAVCQKGRAVRQQDLNNFKSQHQKGLSKNFNSYRITNKEGSHEIENLKKFCLERNLSYDALIRISRKGPAIQGKYKGWQVDLIKVSLSQAHHRKNKRC